MALTSWATGGDAIEACCGLVVETVHEVFVAVDGDLYGGVPEAGLDALGVFAGGDEPGGVGVPQIVDPTGPHVRFQGVGPPDSILYETQFLATADQHPVEPVVE